MPLVLLILILSVFTFSVFLLKIVFPPWNFPRNIPTIPFYTVFLPSILKIDQIELYETYIKESLEKHGAVKIFFGSRWNILVSRPEYLTQIFRDENTFAKSGNQKKIPHSVLAAYTGDNVISAHGEVWRTYRTIMTTPLQQFDDTPFQKNAKLFCKLIEKQVSPHSSVVDVSVSPLIQKLTLDNISQVLLGFDFGTLTQDSVPLHQKLTEIKRQIFHPLFLTFPFLDRLPIPERQKSFREVENFRNILVNKVQEELIKNYQFEQTKFASSELIKAFNNNIINYKQLSDNIVILLVAGHENPQLLLTTLLYLLAKYSGTWQNDIYEEVVKITNYDDLSNAVTLNAFIFEAIRFYPPLNTIINRCTTKTCRLGNDITIPKNAYVGYNNYYATHDKRFWGSTADEFDPKRWGTDMDAMMKQWRRHKTDSSMTSFHGGKRACLGEKMALVEMRVTLWELLKRYKFTLSPNWKEQFTPAGPLCPVNLQLNFQDRTRDEFEIIPNSSA